MKKQNKNIAIAYSQCDFDKYCSENGLNDNNVENLNDMAFISIIGTDDVLKYYLEEAETKHWFKENHTNVLNLEFDDVSKDTEFEGHKALSITDSQAEEIVDFVERNKGKSFICHCRAGMSRSYAIALWITTNYNEYENIEDYKRGHPNAEVMRKLNKIMRERCYNNDRD